MPFGDDPNQPEYQFLDQGKYEAYLEEQLQQMAKGLPPWDRVDTEIVRNISPAPAILEIAGERDIDMIVMGTHGRSALSRFFLGSVAEKVVRHAPCPVLTVAHHRTGYRDQSQYRKILVAFDFSQTSKSAVRRGLEFAEAYGATMEVLYVVEQAVLPPLDEIWKVSVQREVDDVVASARGVLADVLGKEGLEQLNLQVQVGDADGKAEAEIVEYARSNSCDLIIMGTHGYSGLNHALLGSTTERVIRTASCPVLTFHKAKG
jgi:nucleotide-binding universal stress UspA family protein